MSLKFETNSVSSVREAFKTIVTRKKNSATITALDNINLEINTGEKVALLGHNGAGKTSLLRILSKIYIPTSGRFDSRGRLATLFSLTAGMELELSGRENIFQKFSLMGLPKVEASHVVHQIIDFAELERFIDFPIRVYSTGMLMRLAFAISTFSRAEILLMDEWLAVGDTSFSEKAEARLNDMVSNLDILVIATHSEGLARKVCNRLITLREGRIILDEPNLPED